VAVQTSKIRVVADTSQAERALGGLTNTLKGLVTIGAVAGLTQQFVKLSDESTNLQNKMRLVMQEGQTTQQMFSLMAKTAINLGVPLNDVSDLFFRVANNTKDLGLAQTDQLRVTELMLKGFQSTGISMQEASGAVIQFGQALSAGTLRGEELNSILEGAPPIADAIAKQFGVTRGALKSLGEQGLITSRDIIDGMLAAGESIDRDFASRIPTVQNALNVLSTAMKVMVNNTNEATGTGSAFSVVLVKLANTILDVYDWFEKWGKVIGFVIEAVVLLLGPLKIAQLAFRGLIPLVESIIGVFRGGAGVIKNIGNLFTAFTEKLFPITGAVTLLGDRISRLFAILAAGATAIGLGSLISSFKELFSGNVKKNAQTYSDEIDKLNKRLGIDSVQASNLAKKAEEARSTQQLNDAKKWKDAVRDRNESYKEILKSQQDSIGLGKLEGAELKIQEAINSANKQLIKAVKNDKGEILGYTEGLTQSEKENLRLLTLQNLQISLQRETQTDLNKVTQQFLLVKENINNLSSGQLEIELKVLDTQLQYGQALDEETKKKIRSTQETQKQLEYLKQMKASVESINIPLSGAAAGAVASQQLGQLDPTQQALTANQTLMNGLEELRNRDLISEQQYQTAKVSAAVQAQQAIYNATKQQFENAALLRIQHETGTKFGYETQKQMAAEAATFEMKSNTEKYAFAIDQGAQMFTALGAQNKKAFEAAKAFNIANAIMNTYMAATKALATYPPPFSFIAAAAAVGMGLAQVAQIRSQQYSGRALGGPVMGGTPYIVGENGPELFTPNTTGSITRNSDLVGGNSVNVTFSIQAVDTEGFDELLYSRRGLITQVISDAMIEKGQRGI